MRPLRVAIAGCGRMGSERLRTLGENATVIAVADSDVQRARELAARCGSARVVQRVEDLPWKSLDGAFVCTPPASHPEAVELAAAHGVAVLVEKPLALDAHTATQLAAAVARAGIVASVGYMNRYRRGIETARAALRDSRLLGITCYWAGRRYGVPWWGLPAASGGPFNEQGTHLVDLCRYLGGEFAGVCALGNPEHSRVAVGLTLESGALATIFYTCDAAEKRIGIDLLTDRGYVELSGWDFRLTDNSLGADLDDGDVDDPFARETATFLQSITAGINLTRCDFDDACRTQAVVDTIRRQVDAAIERVGTA